MKTHIWNLTETFPGKVNFIDTNNVILGYDLSRTCCEHAFWTISETPDGNNPVYRSDDYAGKEIELDGYRFDPIFFQRQDDRDSEQYVATFKLVSSWGGKKNAPDLFLRLENHHNGYYAHGFTFRGAMIIEEWL